MKKMQKAVAFLLTAVLVLTLLPSIAASVIRASETAETVKAVRLTEVPEGYTGIYTKEDLNNVRNNLAGNYILMNDIVFSEADFAEDGDFYCGGTGWTPIGDSANPFIGIFDGNCYAVKNLYVNVSGSYAGLFGYVRNGKIQNLGMEDGSVSASATNTAEASAHACAGGIAGYNSGTITNCYNTGTVSTIATAVSDFSTNAYPVSGGIVGENSSGTVTNCYNSGNVSAAASSHSSVVAAYAGGIAGRNRGAIENDYNKGFVSATATSETALATAYAGGITGQNYDTASSILSNCSNVGSISATSTSTASDARANTYVGGIVGYNNSGTVTNCCNTGVVSADTTSSATGSHSFAGGIVGRNSFGTVTSCYNTGSVTADSVSSITCAGGIVGNDSGSTTDCYNTGTVSASISSEESLADVHSGGIVGLNYNAGGNLGNTSGTVTNCYNVGSVTAVSATSSAEATVCIGGIAGYNASETVTNCYYLDTASKGAGEGTDACTKCTAEELKEQDTFVGFDFDSVWTMQGDGDYLYPELQNVAGTLVPEKGTDLTVNYTDYVAAEKVYSLDVVWENSDFSFDYDAGSEGTWNPAEHRFENSVPAKWIDDDLNVTVANHSNAAVQASLSVVNLSDKVTVAASQDSATLNSAEGTAIDAAPSFTFVLTVTGEPTESITKAATATVSFASETAPIPVSPSNLTDRVYTLIKPDPDNALGVCDKTLYVRELSFGTSGADSEFTYVCQEHCPCPSTEDPAHACLSYGGESYCMVYGAGAENIYEITGNLINEGSFTLELLSNDTLRVVSATEGLIISVGDIFS